MSVTLTEYIVDVTGDGLDREVLIYKSGEDSWGRPAFTSWQKLPLRDACRLYQALAFVLGALDLEDAA